LDFDAGGISKSVEWQGGGEFIYFELDKYNQKYIDKLNAIKQGHGTAKTIEQLRQYLRYNPFAQCQCIAVPFCGQRHKWCHCLGGNQALGAIKQGHGTAKTIEQLYNEITKHAFLNYDVESEKLLASKKDFEKLSLANPFNGNIFDIIHLLNANVLPSHFVGNGTSGATA
jgi:adenine-specific DNA-methyltransferase